MWPLAGFALVSVVVQAACVLFFARVFRGGRYCFPSHPGGGEQGGLRGPPGPLAEPPSDSDRRRHQPWKLGGPCADCGGEARGLEGSDIVLK